jgi:gluconate 5-dehydrogenase
MSGDKLTGRLSSGLPDYRQLFSIEGKVAIVTGGAGGLGRAIALGLADFGADVAVVGRKLEPLQKVEAEILVKGRKSKAISTDVRFPIEVGSMIKEVVAELGGVDILVNSHGINIRKPAVEFPIEEWESVIDVNFKGVFLCSREAAKVMISRGGGKIVNLSSVSGRLSSKGGYSAYDPSKAAVDGLTRTLACEWARYNIYVNSIAPTWIRTEIITPLLNKPEFYNRAMSRIPLGRIGEVKDVVGIAIFLASEASDFVTGQTIYIDGGHTALE